MQSGRKALLGIITVTLSGGRRILGTGREGGAGFDAGQGLAPTPPMGWNSYDAYCGDVTEQEVRANADYMAQHMARFAGNTW